jgi:hypothetical protein
MEPESKEMIAFKKRLNAYIIKNRYSMSIRYYNIEEFKNRRAEILSWKDSNYSKKTLLSIHEALEIYDDGAKLGLSEKQVQNLFFKLDSERYKRLLIYRKTPQKETRDNKGIYVSSGNSHGNKIRYPKKNRSKKVWTTFYKMFPGCAKVDNWNGETSNRMK